MLPKSTFSSRSTSDRFCQCVSSKELATPGKELATPETPHPAPDKASGLLQTNKTNKEDYTHSAAPADAAPAPHPDVCDVFLIEEEEVSQVLGGATEIESNPTPDSVNQLIEDLAQKRSMNQGTNSAATSASLKNCLMTNELSLPGTPEEKAEFLAWKGELLFEAGKCVHAEARGFALNWAKRHPEEAALIFEDWRKAKNQESALVVSTTPSTAAVANTIPTFEFKPKIWHEKLITAYHQLGEEAFLAQETWHKYWLGYAKTNLSKKLEG